MHFLGIVSALLLASVVQSQSCSGGVRPRKEIRNLSNDEWKAYAAAVNQIKKSGVYDRIVQMHIANQNTVHGGSIFWPWHRWYLRNYEQELQKTNPNVMLPYWDWSYDSQAPETSVVFRADRCGGNGRGSSLCVQDGSFANWRKADGSCLSRNWDKGTKISSFYSPDVLNGIITRSSTYDAFRKGIEINPHGTVHVNIGGDMAQMGSPADPIFWLHHAFIDKIWWTWQKTNKNSYGGTNPNGRPASASDTLPSFGTAKVSDTFDVTKLCYTYAELGVTASAQSAKPPTKKRRSLLEKRGYYTFYSSGVTAPRDIATGHASGRLVRRGDEPKATGILVDADDRQELVNLRHPNVVPDDWCRNNNIKPEEAKSQHKSYAEITAKVNAIEGYISPCSLWLRDDILEKLVEVQKELVAVIKNKPIVCKVDYSKSVTERVTYVKQQVRTTNGGYVRKEVSTYKEKLTSVIGAPAVSTHEATYFYTKPGTHPAEKVEYK